MTKPDQWIDDDLARSGLDRRDRKRMGIEALSAAETYAITGHRSRSYRIPYGTSEGKLNGHYRLRFETPRVDEKGKPKRYSQPKETPPKVHFPLHKDADYWPKITASSKPVALTEGEKKAEAAVKLGIPCVALGGIFSFKSKKLGIKLLSALRKLAKSGRPFEIAFDAEHDKNPQIAKAEAQLSSLLIDAGASRVDSVQLPAGQKLDDYLTTHSAAEFRKLPRRRVGAKPANLAKLDLKPIPAEWLTTKPPPTQFLVDPLFPANVVSLLVGPGGVGKSYLTMWLGMAVAAGARFLGLKTGKGRVVYIAAEDPEGLLWTRVHSIARHYFPGKAERAALHRDFIVQPLSGKQLHLIKSVGNDVVQSEQLAEFIALLKAESPTLVILDPLARLHGSNENGVEVGTALVTAGERIANEIGCSVLVVHHMGKDAARTKSRSAHAARGSSGIPDGARAAVNLFEMAAHEVGAESKAEAEAGRILKLIHSKHNYSPQLSDVWLRRIEHGVLEVFKPELAVGAGEWLDAIRKWSRGKPFSPSKAAKDKVGGCTRYTVAALIAVALTDGRIEAVTEGGKGGGERYRTVEVEGEEK